MMEDGPMKLKLILGDIQATKVVGTDFYCQQIQMLASRSMAMMLRK
jgi:hypothetical protein